MNLPLLPRLSPVNKIAMDFTNRILDSLSTWDRDNLEMSDQLCLYHMINIQLEHGAILLSKLLDESGFKVKLVTDCVKKLMELRILSKAVVNGMGLYEVNLLAEENPCV